MSTVGDWPKNRRDATVHAARILGCPLTVGYTCADECFQVLKIGIRTVSVPSAEWPPRQQLIFNRRGAAMVWAHRPVVPESPAITDGSIDEIKAWPNICDALHLVANSGKVSDGKIVALKQALKRLDRRSDNVVQLPYSLGPDLHMTLPVQMGFSDGVAWDLSQDACQSLAFSKGLADALQPRCTCGRRSFARGKDHGAK
jgi:hypothetical protein